MNVRFLEPAEEEMFEAARIYEDQAAGLGERFLDLPQSGRRVGELRRFPLRKFPFTLIYVLEGAGLVVVALAHNRRRPGYWAGRYNR